MTLAMNSFAKFDVFIAVGLSILRYLQFLYIFFYITITFLIYGLKYF